MKIPPRPGLTDSELAGQYEAGASAFSPFYPKDSMTNEERLRNPGLAGGQCLPVGICRWRRRIQSPPVQLHPDCSALISFMYWVFKSDFI